MSDPHHDNLTTREIRVCAASWREQRDRPDWTEEQQRELEAWMAEAPSHVIAYLRADNVWARAERLSALRRPGSVPGTVGVNWFTGRVKIAAIFAVVAALGAGIALVSLPSSEKTYATAVGGHETLTLRDGSQIELNTNTVLRVAIDTKQRKVTLEQGEAYFQVVHDSKRPFVVTAGPHQVTDLGTKFLVRRDPGRFELALVDGRARFDDLSDKGQSRRAVLSPGDVIVATASSTSLVRKSTQALKSELGWRHGLLVFRKASLADVANELNRYNRQKLVIADPVTARLTIGAIVPTDGVEAFTRVAREIFGLHVENRGNQTVISR